MTPQQTDFGFALSHAPTRIRVKVPEHPIWTENKAKLIERYLYYFVLVTKHGAYIDGFAGPQYPDKPHAWAARLVLENEPRWLRNLFLCEIDQKKFAMLQQMRDRQQPHRKGEPRRTVQLYKADFNVVVNEILPAIAEKEATFCLIDQHTFECDWATVERLARRKQGQKIELFYFLAQRWFGRAFSATKKREELRRWWGRDDFELLRDQGTWGRAKLLCDRFRDELGYRHAVPWPIYSRADGGRIAYHMIHASDHDDAPALMARAYQKAVSKKEPLEQFQFEFTGERPD